MNRRPIIRYVRQRVKTLALVALKKADAVTGGQNNYAGGRTGKHPTTNLRPPGAVPPSKGICALCRYAARSGQLSGKKNRLLMPEIDSPRLSETEPIVGVVAKSGLHAIGLFLGRAFKFHADSL